MYKDMTEMNNKEMRELVCFEAPGIIIYYSNIRSIHKNVIHLINGSDLEASNSDVLDKIKDGKNHYEFYKLMMTKSEAEDMLKNKVEETIMLHYKDAIKAVTATYEEALTSSISTFGKAINSLNTSSSSIASLTNSLEASKLQVQKLVKSTDFSKLQDNLKAKLEDIKPVKAEFQEVVGKLKTLFSD
jgi:hypothetical protein